MLVVGVLSYTSQKQEMADHAERSLTMQSSNMATDISRFLEERMDDAEFLSRNPVLMDQSSSLLDIRAQMYYFLDIYDVYYDTYLTDNEGFVIGDAKNELISQDISDRSWFLEAMKGKSFMSDIYYSTLLEESFLVVAAPVYDVNQNMIGVISPSFNLDSLYDLLEGYTNEQKETGVEGYAFIINEEGTVFSPPNQDNPLREKYFDKQDFSKESIDEVVENNEISQLIDGEVHSFSKIGPFPGFEHEWYIGVSAEESKLYGSLNELLIKYLISFVVVLMLILFAVYRLSTYLVEPIQQLVETTKNFASDEGSDRKYVNTYEEMDHLNATFDHMTRQLEQRENTHKKSSMVLEATDNGVFAIDRITKQITLFNRMCEEVFQRDKDYVFGTTIDEVMTYSKPFEVFMNSGNLQALIEKNQQEYQFEIECAIDGDMRTYHLNVSNLPNTEEDTAHDEMLIVFYDVTEKRQIERELLRSEKLKVVGELSADFAYEIRNPLTTIKKYIQLFNEQSGEDNSRYYPLVIEEIDRVNNIMNELLNIANPNLAEEYEQANVENILKDIIVLEEEKMGKNHIDLETFFQGDSPEIEVNVDKLKQVFTNLIQNGIEAMPDGGRMNIRTCVNNDENSSIPHLVVQVEDSGVGMDTATIEKLGIPFFTTKETGKGLGLTTSYRIIEEMDGAINVSSEVDKGTTFTVYIPINVMETTEIRNK